MDLVLLWATRMVISRASVSLRVIQDWWITEQLGNLQRRMRRVDYQREKHLFN